VGQVATEMTQGQHSATWLFLQQKPGVALALHHRDQQATVAAEGGVTAVFCSTQPAWPC
jgi:hypothetical protein